MAPTPAPCAAGALTTAFSSKDPVLQSEGDEDGDGSGQVRNRVLEKPTHPRTMEAAKRAHRSRPWRSRAATPSAKQAISAEKAGKSVMNVDVLTKKPGAASTGSVHATPQTRPTTACASQ